MTTPLFTTDKAALAQMAKVAKRLSAERFRLNAADGHIEATMQDMVGDNLIGHVSAQIRAPATISAPTHLGIDADKLASALRLIKAGLVDVSGDGPRIILSQPGRRQSFGNIADEFVKATRFPDRVAADLATAIVLDDDAPIASLLSTVPEQTHCTLRTADGRATLSWSSERTAAGASADIGVASGPDAKCCYMPDYLSIALDGAATLRFGADMPLLAESHLCRIAIAPYIVLEGDDTE